MSESHSRQFKGIWIPKHIWLDKRLSYFERFLYAEIDSLETEERGCFASNEYFMEFFGENERKIQRGLENLKKFGYVKVEKFDGRTRTLRVCNEKTQETQPFVGSEVTNLSPLQRQICHPSVSENSIDKRQAEPTPIVDNIVYNNVLSCRVREECADHELGSFSKISTSGQNVRFEISEIFKFALQKHPDWTTEEIKEAIQIAKNYDGHINSWEGFMEGTVQNIKNKKHRASWKQNSTSKNGLNGNPKKKSGYQNGSLSNEEKQLRDKFATPSEPIILKLLSQE